MTAPEPDVVQLLGARLTGSSGGFLRRTLRPSVLTCDVCDGPVDQGKGWSTCYKCGRLYAPSPQSADRVASMVYAVRNHQSGWMMRTYKGANPAQETVQNVGSLLWLGLSHRACASSLAQLPITHWASVPSIPAKPQVVQHPFNRLVANHPYLAVPELPLLAAANVAEPRQFRPTNVVVPQAIPANSHVLLLDDTWVGGGHSESAAGALKSAGAQAVSLLNVARWLNPDDPVTASFMPHGFTSRQFNPYQCPWTGGTCP